MKSAGVAFAAGLGGVLSGWVLAAAMGAAQAEPEKGAKDHDAAERKPADRPAPSRAWTGLRPTLAVE